LTARGFRHARAALFCITYNELWRRQISRVLLEFPSWLGEYHHGTHEFRFHESLGGHVIEFCNMEKLTGYLGAEYAAIAVDELTLCADRETFDLLRGSLRWTDPHTKEAIEGCPFWAASNPTGAGHTWVKRLFVAQDFSSAEDRRLDPAHFAFVRSLPRDNPYLSEQYVEEELGTLPDHLRAPWLEGSWEILAGQRFARFRVHVHVCEPFDVTSLGPVRWYRSIDYGTHDPYACGWYAVVRTDLFPEGEVYKVREDVQAGLPARSQAAKVLERTAEPLRLDGSRSVSIGRIELSRLDPSCWGLEDEGISIADKFRQCGVPVEKALNDRQAGWEMLDDLFYWEHPEGDPFTVSRPPRFHIFNTCPVTIQQVQHAMWDPKRGNDILHPPEFRDDALDETRYFALSHFRPPRRQQEESWVERHKRIDRILSRA